MTLTSYLVGGVETLVRELDWPRALGLIPRLAAAETMDIEGTEMGPDWRGGGGGEGGRREKERGRA